jgi:uncharacterized glyoxalase superfamily protein PhnB
MTEQTSMPALCPHIVCDGAADAIDFYKAAFAAEEMMRMPGQDGRLMHAAITINGAVVLMVDENKQFGMLGPKALGGTPVTLHLTVANADEAIARAQSAGATVTMPAADMFWGDRYGQVKDPWGHNWSIAHPLSNRPMSEDELRAAMAKAGPDGACGEPAQA